LQIQNPPWLGIPRRLRTPALEEQTKPTRTCRTIWCYRTEWSEKLLWAKMWGRPLQTAFRELPKCTADAERNGGCSEQLSTEKRNITFSELLFW